MFLLAELEAVESSVWKGRLDEIPAVDFLDRGLSTIGWHPNPNIFPHTYFNYPCWK